MHQDRHVARDISYSFSARTRGGRAMIRTMENLTGRIRLIKRADTLVRVVVGQPLGRDELDRRARDGKSLMAFLRRKTYELSPRPINPADTGFEFQ